tara:strand:+ start:7122 stop:7226 length:105 start_codon:yes stop_codon:yes gene_type:complete
MSLTSRLRKQELIGLRIVLKGKLFTKRPEDKIKD